MKEEPSQIDKSWHTLKERIKDLPKESALQLLKQEYAQDPRFKDNSPSKEFLESIYHSLLKNESNKS